MKMPRIAAPCCSALLLSCAFNSGAPSSAAAPTQGQEPARPEGTIRFGDAPELAYDVDFFPGAQHDPAITTPDSILGQPHGSRLAHHAEVMQAFDLWAQESDRVSVATFGHTHEGRPLKWAVITSPENHARMDELQANHAALASGALSEAEAAELVESAPAVAWMGYSIHGDELSGTDASLAVAYHLIANQSAETLSMLDELVIVIDPCLNPDGRERIIGMVEQSAGYTPNLNYNSMHRGHWPYGRGNHYLFDMNRDWMAGTQPETRARWRAVQEWNPQLFVDAHEMSSLDSFLMYPQAAPFNPNLPEKTLYWQGVFAGDAGRAFDAAGWSYYTREWADAWGPFYSDAWGTLNGAIGILYEQARTAGFQLRRKSGEILTYREAVHHQVSASFSNLHSLQENRVAVLTDYAAGKRRSVAPETEGNDQWMAVLQRSDESRWRELLRVLDGQSIAYFEVQTTIEMKDALGAAGERKGSLELEKGTLLIPSRQANRQLFRAFFEFDPRIDRATLRSEREELERKNSSKMYDMTAWSLPHAYDIDAWWGTLAEEPSDLRPGLELPAQFGIAGDAATPAGVYAWIIDGNDDSAVAFSARAMEAGLQVNLSDREFDTAEGEWSRGSVLIRRGEQAFDVKETESRIRRAAELAKTTAHRIHSGRAPAEGPDLGGGHFTLLSRPRIAVLSNSPVSSNSYGALWHHLDVRLGVPFTILDAQSFGRVDLRRYNVLILPPGGLGQVLSDNKSSIQSWVRGGGTLVATDSSSAQLTSGSLGLSSVTLRRDALEDLEVYARAVAQERSSRAIEIDEGLVWDGKSSAEADEEEEDDEAAADKNGKSDVPIKERDSWMRRFSPSGANLLAQVDTEHWLTVGCSDRLPIGVGGRNVYLSKGRVETAVRFTDQDDLRLAGLLWPEARERIADSAYLTREGMGNGQIILFAGLPALRGYHLATGRLFANAVVYGPGLGARQPIGW